MFTAFIIAGATVALTSTKTKAMNLSPKKDKKPKEEEDHYWI